MSTTPPFCPTCHVGKLQMRKATYTQVVEGNLIAISHVSALVCDLCGEQTFDSAVLERLSDLLGLTRESHLHTPRRL